MVSGSAPFERRRGDGRSVWWSRGSVIRGVLDSRETGWPVALAEQICPPRYTTPLHVRHEHDEVLLARTGENDIYYGSDSADLNRAKADGGDAIFLPDGAPTVPQHGGRATGRLHPVRIPAGDGVPRGRRAGGNASGGTPHPPDDVLESERVGSLDEKYATDALGPLPIED